MGSQDQRKLLEDRIRGKYWKIGSEESIGRQDQRKVLEDRISGQSQKKGQGKRLNDRITIIDLKIGSAE